MSASSLWAAESTTSEKLSSEQLQQLSQQLGLARQRTWQLLLHHAPGSQISEIDDPGFFLSDNGKSDAAAELEATIEAFFGAASDQSNQNPVYCRFPARYQWLSQQLGIDPDPELFDRCPALSRWQQNFNAGSVSLIFSDYYLNNPPSMFGHTLLRFNNSSGSDNHLLDYTINYAAKVDTDSLLGYAWHGVTGGFEGRFTVSPYYTMVKQYNDMENRDLWEYELDLTQDQVYFMWLHLWELSDTYFDYYFFQENCSYHLLSLIEVARPELQLRDRFPVWTMPAETIRGLDDYPGLVVTTKRRPSLASQFNDALEVLDSDEQKRLLSLVEESNQEALDGLLPQRQALLLDTGSTLLQYQAAGESDNRQSLAQQRHKLLTMRSRLPAATDPSTDTSGSRPVAPGRGHPPANISIAAITVDSEDSERDAGSSRLEVGLSPGYHDLLARAGGHAPNSQITFLSLRLQQTPDREDWEVEQFELIDMRSFVPSNQFETVPSWKLRVGWYRNRDGACADCRPFIINPGIGMAGSTSVVGEAIPYALVEALLEFDNELDDDRRYGLVSTLGVLLNTSEHWRSRIEINRAAFSGSHRGYRNEARWLNRVDWVGDIDLMLDAEWRDEDTIARIGLIAYW